MANITPVAGVTHDLVLRYGDPANETVVGLMVKGGIPGRFDKQHYTPFNPAARQGNATNRDFMIANVWEQNASFHGGIGHIYEGMSESASFANAQGQDYAQNTAIGTCLFTAKRGALLPPPAETQAATGTSSTAAVANFKQFLTHVGTSRLYGLTSDAAGKVFQFDSNGKITNTAAYPTGQLVDTLTAAGTQLFTDGNKIYACQGASNPVRSSTNGTTWANEAYNAHFLAVRDGGTVAYITTATLTPGGTYSTATIGWSGTTATNMRYYKHALYIGKPEGLWTWTDGRIDLVWGANEHYSADNFKFMAEFQGLLFFNLANRLYFTDGNSYVEVIPEDIGGFAEINSLTSGNGGLLIGAKLKTKSGATLATSATSPGTLANDTSVGLLAWSSPSNAASSNDAYASAVNTVGYLWQTNYLKATNFGFSIPSGATIRGVVVEVEAKTGLIGRATIGAKLVVSGTIQGDTKTAIIGGTEAYKTLGASDSTWGNTLTRTIVNASDFGVAVYAEEYTEPSSAPAAYIDHIRITVYYDDLSSYSPINYLLMLPDMKQPGLHPLWSDSDGTLEVVACGASNIYDTTKTRIYFCQETTGTLYLDMDARWLPSSYHTLSSLPAYIELTEFSGGFRAIPKWFYEFVLNVKNPNPNTLAKEYYQIDGGAWTQTTDEDGAVETLTLSDRAVGSYLPINTTGNFIQRRIYLWTTVSTGAAEITHATIRGTVQVNVRYQLAFSVDCGLTVANRLGEPESGEAVRAHLFAAAEQGYPVKVQDPFGDWHLCIFRPSTPHDNITGLTVPNEASPQRVETTVDVIVMEIDGLDTDGGYNAWTLG